MRKEANSDEALSRFSASTCFADAAAGQGRIPHAVPVRTPFADESFDGAKADLDRHPPEARSQARTQAQKERLHKQHKRPRDEAATPDARDMEARRVKSWFETDLEDLPGRLREYEAELREGFDRRFADLQRQCERLTAAAGRSDAELKAALALNAELRTASGAQRARDEQLRAAHDQLRETEDRLRASEEAVRKLRAFKAAIEQYSAGLDE